MECNLKIRIAGIENDSVTDGPGIRFVLFVQGCPQNCIGCHNPAALSFDGGEDMTVEEIFCKIKKNPLLTGVTFSGGEPMSQASALVALAVQIKQADLELAIYTGYIFEEILSKNNAAEIELLNLADTLIDGQFIEKQKSMNFKFKGSKNQRIIDLKASMKEKKAVLDLSERWN